ncbi:MAG TPA: FAD-binding oxidoreductase [Devosiaceae bacterium]|nr:FAD-binding oxidoreductase [Devosiaceae bacterium]
MTDLAPSARPQTEPVRWQTATITAIERNTARISSFWFKPAEPFAFKAGQHVDVRLTAPDGYRAQRSYSIASAPEMHESIELTIERLENGEVSPFFHEVAQVGDEIELRGPLGGHFVWSVADGGPLLLIGGGSGVVPLVSMLRHRAARRSNVPALLFYSARAWEEVIFKDELLAMHEARDGFELAFAITREAPRRPIDFSRRIDMPIIAELLARLPASPSIAFICGSNPFVESAAQGLIDAGLPAPMIRTERYGV